MNLKEYIKSLVRKQLEEMSSTSAIGVGDGPIASPNWVAPPGQKKNAATKYAEKEGWTVTKGETTMPGDSKVRDYVSLTGKKKKKVKIYKESDYTKASQYGAESGYTAASGYTGVGRDNHVSTYYKENMNESLINIVKEELLNEVTYHKFKNEVKFRTKNEQLHKAIREVKRKLSEIDRIVEYTSRMKQELSEGEEGLKYWKKTESNIATISEMVNQLNNKIKNLH
jgi:predicted transcriptional regulator